MTTPSSEPSVPRQVVGELVGTPMRTEYIIDQSSEEQESGAGQAISVHLILNVLRRWWPICTGLGLLTAALAGAIAWYTFQPMYEAVGWLRIESQAPYLVFQVGDTRNVEADQRYIRTQLALLRSPIVLERVLERSEIASLKDIREMVDPVVTLGELVEAESEDESDLYQIKYASESAEASKSVVNAVLEEFLRVVRDYSRERNRDVVDLLREEAASHELEMTQLRSKVIELGGSLTERDDTDTARSEDAATAEAWIQQLAVSEAERTMLATQIKVLEATLASVRNSVDESEMQQFVEADPALQQAQEQLEQDRQIYESMLASLRHDDDPGSAGDGDKERRSSRLPGVLTRKLEQHRKLIDEGQKQLEQARARARQQLIDRETKDLERRLTDLRMNLEAQESLEALLTKNLDRYRQSQATSEEGKVELEFAMSDLQRVSGVYEGLMDRIGKLETETRAPARVTVLKPADAPSDPIESSPLKRIIVSVLTAFCFPFGLILLREAVVQRVGSVEQLPTRQDVPLFAEIPTLPRRIRGGGRRASLAYDRSRAAFENSVHYLCRSLMLGHMDGNFRVLAVTSSVPGEGKTNLSVSIAASMARCLHKPVLLVDTDLRKPHAHQLLGMELKSGLADVLSGKCSLDEAIVATGVEDVWLLSAGHVDLHPHSLLHPAAFERVLGEVRKRFALTVLDTPPALAVGEALTTCKMADGVLLCAMRDLTRRQQIVRTCERLRLAGIVPIGIVFSGVDSQTYASRNGAYYYGEPSISSQ